MKWRPRFIPVKNWKILIRFISANNMFKMYTLRYTSKEATLTRCFFFYVYYNDKICTQKKDFIIITNTIRMDP